MESKMKPVQIRISSADLAEIDRLANEAGLNRSEYIRRRALGFGTGGAEARLRQALRRVSETAQDALKGAR